MRPRAELVPGVRSIQPHAPGADALLVSRPYTRVAVPTEVYLPGGGMVTLPRRTHHHAASASVRTLRARLDAPTDDEQELIDRCRRIESDLAAERDRMAAAEEEAAELEERLARLVAAGDS